MRDSTSLRRRDWYNYFNMHNIESTSIAFLCASSTVRNYLVTKQLPDWKVQLRNRASRSANIFSAKRTYCIIVCFDLRNNFWRILTSVVPIMLRSLQDMINHFYNEPFYLKSWLKSHGLMLHRPTCRRYTIFYEIQR